MQFEERGSTEYSIEQIRALIRDSPLKANDKLPSERDLCRLFNVSRASIRRALEHLKGERLIYSKEKVGMFIAKERIEIDLTTLKSFSNQMKMKNLNFTTTIIKSRIIEADNNIKEKLNLGSDEQVFNLIRLRKIKGEVFSYQNTYISSSKFKNINKFNFETQSLYNVLQEKYNTEIIKGEEWIGIRNEESIKTKVLKSKQNKNLLSFVGVNYNQDNKPVEYIEQLYNPELIEFNIETNLSE